MVPNSDVVGHLTGIFAAFIIKYCGFFSLRLLPRLEWIKEFESYLQTSFLFPATDKIVHDFDLFECPLWFKNSYRTRTIMHYSEQAQPETEDDIERFETKRVDF